MKLNNKNLLNADSCAYFYSPDVWQPEGGRYGVQAIENQIRMIAESGVDTYIRMNDTHSSAKALHPSMERIQALCV